MLENTTLDWNKIYLSPRLATIDTTLRSFQYKILLNKKLYTIRITNTTLCSFCNTLGEIPIKIFFDWIHVKCLWERLQTKVQNDFILSSWTLQTVVLGLYNEANDNYKLLSHILLIFKYYIYTSREKRILNIENLIANIIKVKKREKQVSLLTSNKRGAYKKIMRYR